MCQVQFLEGRLATIVRILLVGGAFLAFWRWSLLSGHARGLILALYGAVLLLVVLLSVLRVRVRARGTMVGREQRTRRQNDRLVTYYHPRVRFTMPDGRPVVFTSAIGSTSEPEPGRSLAIRYRLDDPEQAEVVSAATWVLGAVAILFGLGLLGSASCYTCRSRYPLWPRSAARYRAAPSSASLAETVRPTWWRHTIHQPCARKGQKR
jgi:hypothetical protein